MSPKQKRWLARIVVALILFFAVMAFTEFAPLEEWLGSRTAAIWVEFGLFLIPYLIAGYDVLLGSGRRTSGAARCSTRTS